MPQVTGRKLTRFRHSLQVTVSGPMADKVRRVGDKLGVSDAEVARRCVRLALARVEKGGGRVDD